MNHRVVLALTLAVIIFVRAPLAQVAPTAQAAEWTAETNKAQCISSNTDGLRITPCAGWVKTKQNHLEDFVLELDWRAVTADTDAVLALFGVDGRGKSRWTSAYGLSLFGRPLSAALVAPIRMMSIPIDEAKVTGALQTSERWHWHSVARNEDRLRIAVNGTPVVMASAPISLDGWIGVRVGRGAIEIRSTRLATRAPTLSARLLARGGYIARKGNGVVQPKLRHEERPDYTAAARTARIEGTVVVEIIVDEKGQVVDPQVIRSLDDNRYGLDQAAIQTVKRWQFQAGTYEGKPVPVIVTIELTFEL